MGLWLKQDDGSLVEVSGGGADGADGTDGKGWTGGTYDPATGTVTFTSDDGLEFTTGDLRGADGIDGLDGNMWHVGSGDPAPTLGEINDYYLDGDAGWVWIKRSSGWTNLWVNLTGPPGPGIEDAPSDGDQYARQDGAWTVVSGGGGDYLPLTGGTVTGELEVAGNNNLVVKASSMRGLVLDRTADENVPGLVEFMPSYQAGATTANVKVDGNVVARFRGDQLAWMYGDLKVDGNLTVKAGGTATTPVIAFDGIDGMGIYSHAANQWLRFAVGGAQRLNIREDKVIVNNDLQVDGTINGTLAFGIADGIDTAEMLERADVAVMPAVDDEGVATADAEVESVTVNEVVTALLAKVKQQTTEITTLTATVEALSARLKRMENQ